MVKEIMSVWLSLQSWRRSISDTPPEMINFIASAEDIFNGLILLAGTKYSIPEMLYEKGK